MYFNEPEVGQAIREKIADGTVKRQDIFYCGKVSQVCHASKNGTLFTSRNTFFNSYYLIIQIFIYNFKNDVLFCAAHQVQLNILSIYLIPSSALEHLPPTRVGATGLGKDTESLETGLC